MCKVEIKEFDCRVFISAINAIKKAISDTENTKIAKFDVKDMEEAQDTIRRLYASERELKVRWNEYIASHFCSKPRRCNFGEYLINLPLPLKYRGLFEPTKWG